MTEKNDLMLIFFYAQKTEHITIIDDHVTSAIWHLQKGDQESTIPLWIPLK